MCLYHMIHYSFSMSILYMISELISVCPMYIIFYIIYAIV